MVNEPPKIQEHLTVRCTVPMAGNQSCGFYRKYRVMPKDYDVFGKTREEIQSDLQDNIQAKLLNFYAYHFEPAHPHEAESIRNSVKRTTNYLVLKALNPLIHTESE